MFVSADVANLQEKAARALKSLKSFKEEIAREHRQNFATYAYSSDKGKRPRFGVCVCVYIQALNEYLSIASHDIWTRYMGHTYIFTHCHDF
jgi:hypothetical protein